MKNIFAEIIKADDDKRMVYGYASTEALDVQGEVVTKEAMAGAVDEYMKFANIREMHQPSAVGVAKSMEIDDKGAYISAHVVDDAAWKKVKEGVYKGFSIGGKAISKVDGVIKSLKLTEISLVDRPANPEALITVWKADGVDDPKANPALDALAELLNKGEITPERLVELAKAEKAEVKKGYFGEEIWDAQVALNCLSDLIGLLYKESSEEEQMPEQIAALVAAVEGLKAFIGSELTENNSVKFDSAESLAKAGKEISSKNMSKLQALHDSLVGMGAACGTEKHDHAADIAKADTEKGEALAKLADAESTIAKLSGEMEVLKAENEKLKAEPAETKAVLKTVEKSTDGTGDAPADTQIIKDHKGDVNEVASMIKMVHSKGGVIVR